jgi:hypothetical protein
MAAGDFIGEPLSSRSDPEEAYPSFVHATRANGRLVLTRIDVTVYHPQPPLQNWTKCSWDNLRKKIGIPRTHNQPRQELGLPVGHDSANGSGILKVLKRLIVYPWVQRMDPNDLQNRHFTLKEIEQGYFLNFVHLADKFPPRWSIGARLDSAFGEPQGRWYVTIEHAPNGQPYQEYVRTLGDYADGRDGDGRWNDQPPDWFTMGAAAWAEARVTVDRRLSRHNFRRDVAEDAAAAPADDHVPADAYNMENMSESTESAGPQYIDTEDEEDESDDPSIGDLLVAHAAAAASPPAINVSSDEEPPATPDRA